MPVLAIHPHCKQWGILAFFVKGKSMKEDKKGGGEVPPRISFKKKLDLDWEQSDFKNIFMKPFKPPKKDITLSGDKYRMLLEFAKALNSIRNLQTLFLQVIDIVLKISRMERGYLFLLGNDDRFAVKAARDRDKNNLETGNFRLPESIIAEISKTGHPMYLADIEKIDEGLSKGDGHTSVQKASICFPMKRLTSPSSKTFHSILEGKSLTQDIIGLIYLEGHTPLGQFPRVDLEFLEALAAQATIAMENAKLYSRLKNEREKLAGENMRLKREIRGKYGFNNIIGASPKINKVFDLIDRLTRSDVNVLIRGESGTGKDLVAKTIHYNSPRAKLPYVEINCAAMPETLLESELFGIEKGVATGVTKRIGKFEAANGGTLFLDEIGDMSLNMQAKLLRVLEERKVERIGGSASIPIDVRIITATNKNLEQAIHNGTFREDLYFRLNVVPIFLPPLRERLADIPLLIEHFLNKNKEKQGKKFRGVSQEAMEILMNYDWPGNVRELENVLQRAMVMADGDIIEAQLIPTDLFRTDRKLIEKAEEEGWTADRLLREYAVRLFRKNKGNLTKTAKDIGIDFKTLKKKLGEGTFSP
jgi:Nif-specific regulatory protein